MQSIWLCKVTKNNIDLSILSVGLLYIILEIFFGHSSVQVTKVYARADSRQKREVIEKAYTDVSPEEKPQWQDNDNILSWLKRFNQ